MEKKRITWIDTARGYAIILMILGHLGAGRFGTWIYSFHIPLFFFLSGYLFSAKRKFPEFFVRKFRSIMIPYFCLGLPVIALNLLSRYRGGALAEGEVQSTVLDFLIQKRYLPFWFLTCLFLLSLIFYGMVRCLKKEWMLILVSVLAAIFGECYYKAGGAPLVWNLDACLMALPFFCAGYLCRQHRAQIDPFFEKQRRWLLPVFLAVNLLAHGLGLWISGASLEMYRSEYGCFPLVYLSAFAGIFMMILVSQKGKLRWVTYIGENSMIYFAWHGALVQHLIPRVGHVLTGIPGIGAMPDSILKIGYLCLILVLLTVCSGLISVLHLKWLVGKTE